jgi:hypothetical protein
MDFTRLVVFTSLFGIGCAGCVSSQSIRYRSDCFVSIPTAILSNALIHAERVLALCNHDKTSVHNGKLSAYVVTVWNQKDNIWHLAFDRDIVTGENRDCPRSFVILLDSSGQVISCGHHLIETWGMSQSMDTQSNESLLNGSDQDKKFPDKSDEAASPK